jgi:hypothetical protein
VWRHGFDPQQRLNMTSRHLILVGAAMELAYLSFYVVDEPPHEVLLFIIVNAFAFLLLTFLLIRTRHFELSPLKLEPRTSNPAPPSGIKQLDPSLRSALRAIFGFAVLFRLTLVVHAPVASDDIYRYVWDGKVATHGINPFRYAPTDSALAALHTADLPSKINHPTMRTIYPPLAQVLFFVSNKLFGDSLIGLKFLLVLADICTIVLLYKLYQLYELRQLVLYAWSPLPIMYFGLDGHIDALGIPFLLLFLYLATHNRYFTASISLGIAGVAKLYPLFVAPFLFHVATGWRRLVLPLVPIAMLLIGGWLYWEPTGGLVESFMMFSSVFAFNGSVFHIVYEVVKTNNQAHSICALVFLFWLGVVFFLKRSLIEKIYLAFLGFIIFAPVVQPWYLTWLAALLVLRWSPAAFALLGLSNLSNFVVYHYRLTGVWTENEAILLVQYLPFYCVLVWETVKGKFS